MLSKRVYDIISILVLVLFVGSVYFSNQMSFNAIGEASSIYSEGGTASDVVDKLQNDPSVKLAGYIELGGRLLGVAYWILILVLAVQLYKKKKVSMLDVVLVVLLVPLAIVFYFLTLRKHIGEVEDGGNVPDSAPVQQNLE